MSGTKGRETRRYDKNARQRHTKEFEHKRALNARHKREEDHIRFLEEEIEELWEGHEFFET